MTLDDLLFDIHVLEYELQTFERRFGVLSEMFYEAWSQGEEPADDSWVLSWAAWAGAYESWREYRQEYMKAVRRLHPDIKHNRVPAPGISFATPNLPFLIHEIESLIDAR